MSQDRNAERSMDRWRGPLLLVLDPLAWVAGLSVAAVTRYDFTVGGVNRLGLALGMVLAVTLQWGFGALFHVYLRRYRPGSVDEIAALAITCACVGTVLLAATLLGPDRRILPASVPYAGAMAAFLLMACARWLPLHLVDRASRGGGAGAQGVLVFGAGEAGYQVVRAMVHDPDGPYHPVGLLDDDPRKRRLRIEGVRVLGTRHDIAAAARTTGARAVLIAVPTAGAAVVRDVAALIDAAGLHVKVLPSMRDLIDARVRLGDIRDIDVSDLLGRHQVRTDIEAVAGYLTGRRVLITGAGGSIGSELCRQIHRYAPAELIMLDRDESALHAVQLSIHGRAMLDTPETVLGDIRDVTFVDQLMHERQPQVVFHAAALKHLPLLERFPGEAVKTNVWGTLTLLEASKRNGVERFVHISTDKAADPISVLGDSKRIAEMLTAEVDRRSPGGHYLSVRFGNVLGSRGSVIGTFSSQIASGGPVTVTDPGATRFFMTISEAVELVIQAAALGDQGEVLVLDMGRPVSILEVARQLIAQSRRPCAIVYTGLRPGEKLHESRLGAGEVDIRRAHPQISHVPVPGLDVAAARELEPWKPARSVAAQLRRYARADPVYAGGAPASGARRR